MTGSSEPEPLECGSIGVSDTVAVKQGGEVSLAPLTRASAIPKGRLPLIYFYKFPGPILLGSEQTGGGSAQSWDHWRAPTSEATVWDSSRCGYRAKARSTAHAPHPRHSQCHPQEKVFLICLPKFWWLHPAKLAPAVGTAGCNQPELVVHSSWGYY